MAISCGSSLVFLLIIASGSCNNAPSVIIIGAGSAGIAAASRLLENGFSNITVLEAEDRIGGRIDSVPFGDVVVDLGAQWCPEDDQNVVYKMVKDYDLTESVDFSVNYVYSSRGNIDENLGRELNALCKKIYGEISEKEISVGDYVINKYNQSITEMFGNNKEKLDFAWEVLNAFKGEVLILEAAFSWFDVSAKITHMEEKHGGVGWKGKGYKTILDVLIKAYPDPNKKLPVTDKTILNKEVTEIVWDDTSSQSTGVIVKCSDNSIYTADHVISTVSLGVLKDRYDSLFQPPLPQEKLDAIEELGIGAVMKVALTFPEKWWPNSSSAQVHLCWLDEDRSKLLQEFPHGPNDDGHSWLEDLVQFFPSERNSNVLIAWFTGRFVPQIEMLSDSTIVDGVIFTLRKFLGHQFNITRPNGILRFNWYSNPHFRGVCSFETLESRKRKVPAQLALLNPVTSQDGKMRLLFAGEATNLVHYCSVHGAIETGYREADRIRHYYQNSDI